MCGSERIGRFGISRESGEPVETIGRRLRGIICQTVHIAIREDIDSHFIFDGDASRDFSSGLMNSMRKKGNK